MCSGLRILIAASRPSFTWRPSQTRPIAPSPRHFSRLYEPSTSPCCSFTEADGSRPPQGSRSTRVPAHLDAAQQAREVAARLRAEHPTARYELDWKTPEQLLVATMLAAGSKDSAVNEVTRVLFGRWPDLFALAKAEAGELAGV